MKEFVKKMIGRLEEQKGNVSDYSSYEGKKLVMHWNNCVDVCKEIVNQLAEEYGKDINVTTNADFIRKMNDEELADFLEEFEACDVCKYLDNNRCTFENPCVHKFAGAMIYDWLQSEVKGSDV